MTKSKRMLSIMLSLMLAVMLSFGMADFSCCEELPQEQQQEQIQEQQPEPQPEPEQKQEQQPEPQPEPEQKQEQQPEPQPEPEQKQEQQPEPEPEQKQEQQSEPTSKQQQEELNLQIQNAFIQKLTVQQQEEEQHEEEQRQQQIAAIESEEYYCTIFPQGTYQIENGVYVFSYSNLSESISFAPFCTPVVESFSYTVTDENGSTVGSGSVGNESIVLPVAAYANGTYTLQIVAIQSGIVVGSRAVTFRLNQERQQQSGWGSVSWKGFSGGGRRGGGSTGGMGEQEEKIVAGTALTSTHAAGSAEMIPDNGYQPIVSDSPSDTLTLGGTSLDLKLNNGDGTFTSSIQDNTLVVEQSSDSEQATQPEAVWTISLDTVEKLKNSGISQLVLKSGENGVSIPTDLTLNGYQYGLLRSQGYVSKDMQLCVSGGDTWVRANDTDYALDANHNLISK